MSVVAEVTKELCEWIQIAHKEYDKLSWFEKRKHARTKWVADYAVRMQQERPQMMIRISR